MGHTKKKDGFLNKFIRYETATTALQYFSFALWGVPYMGVGRNLAYSKKTYIDNQGFASHKHIASGDDDLFISEVATGENTQICLNPSSFMYSKPESNIKNYHVKKTRHFSTGKHYKRHIVLLLSLFSASQIVFYASIVALLKFDIEVSTVMILFIFRMLLILLVFGKILKKLREPDLIPFIPLFDILYVVYYVLFIPAVMLNNTTKQWK